MYQEVMDFLEQRMLFAEDFAPAFLCSIGAHIANVHQFEEPFYFIKGVPENLKLSVAIVSPSGFSKSYTMKMFGSRMYGISPLKAKFEGKITEAGFVGSVSMEGEPEHGLAYHYRNGVLMFNEITNLFFATEQGYSKELINQVMESLSEDHVSKTLKSGTVEYDTHVTIWGGVQPRRFDFSGGLGRRFIFVTKQWTQDDIDLLKFARINEKHLRPDKKEIKRIRMDINLIDDQFDIKEIDWKGGIKKDFLFNQSDSHLQMSLFERMLIGKAVMECSYSGDHLIIENSQENRNLILRMLDMQDMVAEGSDISLMTSVLRDTTPKNPMSDDNLWRAFRRFGYSYEIYHSLLDLCIKMGMIKTKAETGGDGVYHHFFYVKKRRSRKVDDTTKYGDGIIME